VGLEIKALLNDIWAYRIWKLG